MTSPCCPASLSPNTPAPSIQPLDDAEEEEIRDLQETPAASELEAAVEILEVAEEVEEEPDDAPIAEETLASAEPEGLIVATEVVVEVDNGDGAARRR